MWKRLDGYFWPYRINEDGHVERQWDDGKWRPVKAYIMRYGKGPYAARVLAVHMKTADGRRVNAKVKHLMVDAFMGGHKPGDAYTLRNGCVADCSLGNIVKTNQSTMGKIHGGGMRKSVEKVDRDGNVLALYSSVSEAAEKNYVSRKSVYYRCTGKCKDDPFNLTGYTFRFEKVEGETLMERKRYYTNVEGEAPVERKRYYTNVIEKVDRDGNVVEVYPSMAEAVRQNDMGRKAIQRRCDGLFEGDPFKAIGYTFRYRRLKGD